jgi:preprotein translocase subunit SecE
MSKEKSTSQPGVLRSFLSFKLYKRNQGRITRQVSFAVMAVVIALAAWRLNVTLYAKESWLSAMLANSAWLSGLLGVKDQAFYDITIAYLVSISTLVLGVFSSYRIVNMPRFADFLISVEAEMNKVSWPSRGELVRSTIVVIAVIFFLALTLFTYDLAWSSLFKAFGISAS